MFKERRDYISESERKTIQRKWNKTFFRLDSNKWFTAYLDLDQHNHVSAEISKGLSRTTTWKCHLLFKNNRQAERLLIDRNNHVLCEISENNNLKMSCIVRKQLKNLVKNNHVSGEIPENNSKMSYIVQNNNPDLIEEDTTWRILV